jgi:hypothetical protein
MNFTKAQHPPPSTLHLLRYYCNVCVILEHLYGVCHVLQAILFYFTPFSLNATAFSSYNRLGSASMGLTVSSPTKLDTVLAQINSAC